MLAGIISPKPTVVIVPAQNHMTLEKSVQHPAQIAWVCTSLSTTYLHPIQVHPPRSAADPESAEQMRTEKPCILGVLDFAGSASQREGAHMK